MELGPIFRALVYSKSRFWLVAVEIALTLAVIVNCVAMIREQRDLIERPTGMDVENILVVQSQPFAPDFQDDDYVQASADEDLRALRAMAGVRAASATRAVPLSGGGSATGRRAAGTEGEVLTVPFFTMTDGALETLGVELIAGRAFVESDFVDDPEGIEATAENPRQGNVIVTKNLADVLYPDGDALGKTIETKSGAASETIVGIIGQMHGSWPLSDVAERVALFPGSPAASRGVFYLVRTEPGRLEGLYTAVEERLLEVNDGRLVSVESLTEVKDAFYRELSAVNKLLAFVSVLLVFVTSLGIIGLTSFSVTQRTRQIGTRRALGATRIAILRYFLVENWIITGVGLALGVVLSYSLNFILANVADVPRLEWPMVGSGMLLLWLIGLLAALTPAIRGTFVPPVIATKTI